MKKRLYYSHSMKTYNTLEEESQIAYIEQRFPDFRLINPNDLGDLQPFDNYLSIITNMDLIVCSEYQSFVGRGVYEEIFRAIALKKPVFVMRPYGEKFRLYKVTGIQLIGANNQINYGKLVTG